MSGPYETEPRPEWAKVTPGLGSQKNPNQRRLKQALDGLQLGAYDRSVALWLSDWESSTVEVIASWIERARTQKSSPGSR